jgi:uncharacterized protein (DUF302 family)
MSENGMTAIPSAYPVPETIDRLERTATSRGLTVFARIDHGAGAAKVGMALRPTVLVLFGHPRGGTPLMQERQTAGLDLPLKALAWEDAEGRVWHNATSSVPTAVRRSRRSTRARRPLPMPPPPPPRRRRSNADLR